MNTKGILTVKTADPMIKWNKTPPESFANSFCSKTIKVTVFTLSPNDSACMN